MCVLRVTSHLFWHYFCSYKSMKFKLWISFRFPWCLHVLWIWLCLNYRFIPRCIVCYRSRAVFLTLCLNCMGHHSTSSQFCFCSPLPEKDFSPYLRAPKKWHTQCAHGHPLMSDVTAFLPRLLMILPLSRSLPPPPLRPLFLLWHHRPHHLSCWSCHPRRWPLIRIIRRSTSLQRLRCLNHPWRLQPPLPWTTWMPYQLVQQHVLPASFMDPNWMHVWVQSLFRQSMAPAVSPAQLVAGALPMTRGSCCPDDISCHQLIGDTTSAFFIYPHDGDLTPSTYTRSWCDSACPGSS